VNDESRPKKEILLLKLFVSGVEKKVIRVTLVVAM